jgi:hypothetical protein
VLVVASCTGTKFFVVDAISTGLLVWIYKCIHYVTFGISCMHLTNSVCQVPQDEEVEGQKVGLFES